MDFWTDKTAGQFVCSSITVAGFNYHGSSWFWKLGLSTSSTNQNSNNIQLIISLVVLLLQTNNSIQHASHGFSGQLKVL
jgi:hypothetical protein